MFLNVPPEDTLYLDMFLIMQSRSHVTAAMLEEMGHFVVVADNGVEAIDIWRAEMLFTNTVIDTGVEQSPVSLQTGISSSTAPKTTSNFTSKVGSLELSTGLGIPFDVCLMDLTLPVHIVSIFYCYF